MEADCFYFIVYKNYFKKKKTISVLLVPLPFHINIRLILSISIGTFAGILIGFGLKLYINLERTDIFTMLSLLIHKHNISF